MQEKNEDIYIKRMANHLRKGSTLTDLSCPACSSPLFRLRNETLWCARCEKKVIVVKEGEELEKKSNIAYKEVEATLMTKVKELQNKIQKTENLEELQKLSGAVTELLSNLEKIKKMQKN